MVTIEEEDIKLTIEEKFSDFFSSSILIKLVQIPFVLTLLLLLPIIIVSGLIYEYIIEKYFYKLIGVKQTKENIKFENPFAGLPISVDSQSIDLIDNCIKSLKDRYGLSDDVFDDFEIEKIITDPIIADLSDRYFDSYIFVFQDKLFVQEIKFPDFRTALGYIDCKSLSYQTIKDFESYTDISFAKTNDELEITIRQIGIKKIIRVK